MANDFLKWKNTLATTPNKPTWSLVSLYDLFYDSTGKLWIESTEATTAGTKLAHDIICFNKNIVSASNAIDISQTTEISTSAWWTYGLDISIPRYDARAKYKEVPCAASIGSGNPIKIFSRDKFRIYDKEAALAPNSVEVFTNYGVLTSGSISNPTWDNYLAPSIGVFTASGNPSDYSEDILLSNEDLVFKSTLVTQDSMYAYNRVFLNPYTFYAICLVIKATGMNAHGLLGSTSFNQGWSGVQSTVGTTFRSYENFWNLAEQTDDFVAHAVNLGDNSHLTTQQVNTSDSTRWSYLLKNTYVWFRAPFFGDYVKPDNFEQDLTPNSSVVHSELMLSGAGDFKKYDTFLSATGQVVLKSKVEENDFANTATSSNQSEASNTLKLLENSESSLPYIPKTSPTIDIYTSELLDSSEFLKNLKDKQDDTTNYSSKLNFEFNKDFDGEQIGGFLEAHASGNEMDLKGLPIAAINRSNALEETYGSDVDDLTPPGWFNPESRHGGAYYAAMGKFPTVVPKDGNLYVDGRIIGPTIDEIWIMLKKLTGGRLSDFVSDGEGGLSSANLGRALALDIGIPYGSSERVQNDTNTTLTEVPNSEFNFRYKGSDENDKYGDPIDFVYEPGNEADGSSLFDQKLKITKFINQNDSIVYPIYKSLKDLSSDITTFDTTRTEDELGERDISRFTAWNNIKERADALGDNATVLTGAWGPREMPYSLRELEAMIMGNKYNIITQARFLKENFAVTGKLGKIHGDEDPEDLSNYTAGSLYQMHRNYNFDITNPNTFYNYNGTNSGYSEDGKTVGMTVQNNDNDIRSEELKRAGHIRYFQDYATSKDVSDNPEFYSSIDVYLSAYGDWRSTSFYNRVPCLRDEY